MKSPHNVIADTFLRLLCSYLSSPLVGKKAANVVSNSESNNRNESSHSLLMDDRGKIDCLVSLLCLSSRKKREKVTSDMQKVFQNDIGWEQILVVISFFMIPLLNSVISISPKIWLKKALKTWEHQGHKTMVRNSCSLQLSTQKGTVTRLSTMLKTSWITLNQVIIQPTGKFHYLRTW